MTRALRFTSVFLIFALLQIPFLKADADRSLSSGRATYTDEGLYSAQVRNAITSSHFSLDESDGVIKAPLFAGANWVFARYFGDSMVTARTCMVLATTLLLALIASGSSVFARTVWIAVPLVFFSYYPFNYAHLDMAEFLCCLLILVSVGATEARLRGSSRWAIAGGALASACAYAVKIQYLYVAGIAPLAFLIAIGFRHLSGLPIGRRQWGDVGYAALLATIFGALFGCIWVLPYHELFLRVLTTQLGERVATTLSTVLLHSLRVILEPGRIWPTFALFFMGVYIITRQWRETTGLKIGREDWIASIAPLAAWLVLESHDLKLSYLPSRYLLSMYLALGMFGAVGLALISRSALKSMPRTISMIIAGTVVLVLSFNIIFYVDALYHRQYALYNAQSAFRESGNWRGKVVLGPWAAALFWGTGAITRPVWAGYFNDKDILNSQHPSAIVTEPDQQDSQMAFAHDGIQLPGTPNRTFRVGPWTVELFEVALGTSGRSFRQ
jgi:hypothetical protein